MSAYRRSISAGASLIRAAVSAAVAAILAMSASPASAARSVAPRTAAHAVAPAPVARPRWRPSSRVLPDPVGPVISTLQVVAAPASVFAGMTVVLLVRFPRPARGGAHWAVVFAGMTLVLLVRFPRPARGGWAG